MSDIRITQSQALLRGLDTMLHKELTGVAESTGASFASILQNVIGDTNAADAAAHTSIENMAIGDYDQDVVMLNSTKAEMTLSLTVAVRDKVVEAYKEIMNMQI